MTNVNGIKHTHEQIILCGTCKHLCPCAQCQILELELLVWGRKLIGPVVSHVAEKVHCLDRGLVLLS